MLLLLIAMFSNKLVILLILGLSVSNVVFGTNWTTLKSLSSLNPRIIGGDEAEPNSFPYQVGLLINGNAFCGGSLISENYVLTAAHCGSVIRNVDVILGAHNITSTTESTQIRIKGGKVTVHEDYSMLDYHNDIALIKLSEPVKFNAVIQPVALPTRAQLNETYANKVARSTGWGLAHDVPGNPSLRDMSPVLRFVDVQVLDLEECEDYYNDYENNILYVTENNICTSGYKNKGTCNGDSGGPIVVDGMQVGLVSIGSNLCEICSPSIFTHVGKFLDWIESHSDVVVM